MEVATRHQQRRMVDTRLRYDLVLSRRQSQRADAVHGVARVRREIHENGLKLSLIGQKWWQRAGGGNTDFDAGAKRVRKYLLYFRQQDTHLDRLRQKVGPPGEGEQPRRHRGAAFSGAQNDVRQVADFSVASVALQERAGP